MTDEAALNETDRRIGDLVRLGRVASVDLAARRCTVEIGDITSGPVRWKAERSGKTRKSSPPSVGEQAILLSPDGEIGLGVALVGIESDEFPGPDDQDRDYTVYVDGAVIMYDPTVHRLEVTLPAGGVAEITAPGGVIINAESGVTVNANAGVDVNGDLRVTGKISATGDISTDADVKAGPITLKTHKTSQVQPGTGVGGPPVP